VEVVRSIKIAAVKTHKTQKNSTFEKYKKYQKTKNVDKNVHMTTICPRKYKIADIEKDYSNLY